MSLALETLMCICNAQTPLSAAELSDILSLDITQKRTLNPKYRPSPLVIVECCQGLISYDETTDAFLLVHMAAQEHLMSHEIRIFGDSAAKLVTQRCLLYTLDPAFDRGPMHPPKNCSSEEAIEQTTSDEVVLFLHHHPFFKYVSHNLGWHACSGHQSRDSEIQALLLRFLQSRARVARIFQILRATAEGFHTNVYFDPRRAWSAHSIRLACEYALTDMAYALLDKEDDHVDVNVPTWTGSTLLTFASSRDQLDLVLKLLQRGADPSRTSWYGNALHCAAQSNSLLTLRKLLDWGVGSNMLSPMGLTVLDCAVHNGSIEAAKILYRHGAAFSSTWGNYLLPATNK